MARVPAFQAGYAGSIPVTRSIDNKMTPSLRGVILLSMHWSLESGGAQRRIPSPGSTQSWSAATDPVTRVHPIVKRSDGSRHPGLFTSSLRLEVILECESHCRWNSWYSDCCNVRGRFSSLGRHRFAVVSLTRKTSVATTPHRDWSHLAIQLRNAHHRKLGCGHSPLKHSASCLADVSHAQRIGRSRMGMAIF